MFIEIRVMLSQIISTGVKCRLILLHNQSKTIMKTKIIISALLILALLPGCFIKSIHPFYTDKDLVYKEELLGKWTGKDDSNWEISRHMRKAGLAKADIPDKAYDISYSNEKGTSRFIAIFSSSIRNCISTFILQMMPGIPILKAFTLYRPTPWPRQASAIIH